MRICQLLAYGHHNILIKRLAMNTDVAQVLLRNEQQFPTTAEFNLFVIGVEHGNAY